MISTEQLGTTTTDDVPGSSHRRADAWATQALDATGEVPNTTFQTLVGTRLLPTLVSPQVVPSPPDTVPSEGCALPDTESSSECACPETVNEDPLLATTAQPAMAFSLDDDKGEDPLLATTEQPAMALPTEATEADGAFPGTVEMPVLIDDDAYFHPGGRIKSIHDTTHGWRLEPTPTVIHRLRERSQRSWIVLGLVALLAPIILLGVVVTISHFSRTPVADRRARLHTPESTRSPLAQEVITLRQVIPTRTTAMTPTRNVKSSPRRSTRRPR